MPTFRCQGQEWTLPNINPDSLPNVRPSLFISYFFAIESNKREPASSNNKHFLTEAFRALLEYKLGYRQGGEDMAKALQWWKDNKYWTVGHGGPNDPYSTRNDLKSYLEEPMTTMGHSSYMNASPDKQFECFFWRRNGFCKFSDDECTYAHYPTGKVKEYIDGKDKGIDLKPYKTSNGVALKQTECFFWTQGTCKFSDDECMYAHYPINRGTDLPEWRDRGRRDDPSNSFRQDSTTNARIPKVSDKQLECYYWRYTDFCKYSEDDCLYAHHSTGRVKDLPGMPRNMEPYQNLPESKRAIEHPKSDQKDPKIARSPMQYAMPGPTTMKLSELTLSAFLDLFCYSNPTARKERPWETVLTYYKDYITKSFGKDTMKHIIVALSRTKQPIPPELLKSQISSLEAELASKNLLGALESEVSGGRAPSSASKRPRADGEEQPLMTPKRMKWERDSNAEVPESDIVSEFLRQIPQNDHLNSQEQSQRTSPRQAAQLYSPSMPHIATGNLTDDKSTMNGVSGNQTVSVEHRTLNGSTRNNSHEKIYPPIAHRSHLSDHPLTKSSPVRPTTAVQGDRGSSNFSGNVTAVRHQSASPKVASKENNTSVGRPSASNLLSSLPGNTNNLRHATSPPLFRKQGGEASTESPPRFSIGDTYTGDPKGNNQPSRAPSHSNGTGHTSMELFDRAVPEPTVDDASIDSKLGATKPTKNGYRSPPSSLCKTPTSKLPCSNEMGFRVPHSSSIERKDQEAQRTHNDQGAEQKYATNGNIHVGELVSVPSHMTNSLNGPRTFTYQEEVQEPISANIVRLEALLRGALVELETLKRTAR